MSIAHREAPSIDPALLHAMVDNAVDGIIAIDQAGSVQIMNAAAQRLFGYGQEEVRGRNVSMLMPEPFRGEHDRYVRSYLDTGQARIIGSGREVRGLRKDGSTFPMYLSVAEVRRGEHRLFTGIVHDLTALDHAREQVARLEHQQSLILNSVGDGILGLDDAGQVSFANPAACAMLAWTAAEIIGQPIESIWDQSHRGTCPPPDAHHPEPFATESESRFRRRDGSTFPVECTRVAVNDPGVGVGTVVSFRDVSEQRRAAREMQRMRSYMRNIIDSMPSVLVGVDTQGRITEWNKGAEQATGTSAAAAHGRHYVELLPRLRGQEARLREAIEGEPPLRPQRLVEERDGEVHYADVVIYPLRENGTAGAVIRMDDVTNRVRLEQMMAQTEKMMSVGGLAAGMAHEINNPLSAVLQGCQNMFRRLSPELPANRQAAAELELDLERVQRYLERRNILRFLEGIQESATRATRIVTDMLSFSRRSDARFTRARLQDLLETVVRLVGSDYDLRRKYDFRQITIERQYDPELPPVHCDPMAVEQVFLNIVKNAAEAMATGGGLPHRLILRTLREGEFARVEIEDNGPGMDEKTRQRLFEPFYTTKPAGRGTGLGLSVSYFIVTEQHAGSMGLDPGSGQGTCFVIRLPLQGRAIA